MSYQEPNNRQVEELLTSMAGQRIAVVGDAMLDAYLQGEVQRISPEAPVPVLHVQRETFKLGGAANVASCLRALGADVKLVAVIGDDADGQRFVREAAEQQIDTAEVVVDSTRPTTRKTRVVARNQQVIRFDHESLAPVSSQIESRLLEQVQSITGWADGIILSDYSKGVLSDAVCKRCIHTVGSAPVIVDPKKLPWNKYSGATLIKPNRSEAELFTGISINDDEFAEAAARKLSAQLQTQNVLFTRGADGMTLIDAASEALHLAARPRDLVDVTGAGDVTAAVLTLAMVAGANPRDSAWLSNIAAGIKVGKFGAETVTADEILACIGGGQLQSERKVMTRQQVATLAENVRQRGKRVVFTNGCFDLLHVGHISYLERSRRLGDMLIVGVNSDDSVRRLKGPTRPIQTESDRAQILAAQACVDAVVVFDEDTPVELLKLIRPDVLTKGGQYESKQAVVGWELVESWNGQVALVDHIDGKSTTALADRAA